MFSLPNSIDQLFCWQGKVRKKMETCIIKVLNFSTKKGDVYKAEPPLDLKEAFSKFAGGENQMKKDQLLRFMVEHQGENISTIEDLDKIVEKFLQLGSSCSSTKTSSTRIVDVYRKQGLSLNDFIDFLLLGDFNGPLKDEVCTFSD